LAGSGLADALNDDVGLGQEVLTLDGGDGVLDLGAFPAELIRYGLVRKTGAPLDHGELDFIRSHASATHCAGGGHAATASASGGGTGAIVTSRPEVSA
jgi:hypothetical protein